MKLRAVILALASMVATGCGHDGSLSGGYTVTDEPSLRRIFATDAGMHGLWSPDAYRDVDYRNWEDHFVRDGAMEAHIKRGEFVPINVYSDGAPLIEVRVARQSPARLSEQERTWVKAASEPYLFVSTGVANVSGIELIGGDYTGDIAAEISGITVPAGRWQATVYLLEWPERVYDAKTRYPPQLLVTLNPETSATVQYRQVIDTFGDKLW